MRNAFLAIASAVFLLSATATVCADARPGGQRGQYGVVGRCGGSPGYLDTLDITAADAPNEYDLIDGDVAVEASISGVTVTYEVWVFDADGTDAEDCADVVRPDDYATAGVWRRYVADEQINDLDELPDDDTDNDKVDHDILQQAAEDCLSTAPGSPYNGQTECADGDNWQPGGADQGTDDWLVRYRTSDTSWVAVYNLTDGMHIFEADLLSETISFVIDGWGSAITTGAAGWVTVPYDCTITAGRLLADQSGSIQVDVWVDTYANFPPTDGDSITASAPLVLSTAQNSRDATLTGWTVALTAGDVIGFYVDSVSTVERVDVALEVSR
jgi:hypothetical protein